MNELDIFSAALELTSHEERAEYLNKACAENLELRRRIETLLRSSGKAESLMESPPSGLDFAPTRDVDIFGKPGMLIGPYKLLQEIGRGGMGMVYMAEQNKPVKRRVALKIIKPGMDNRQVIARFEAERQALALMDHPNIAKVLDGGTTESGSPYFVMELVKGVPITKYCDQQHLTPNERLALFVPICQAVQHAHQKGIIHRDLKPNNVLVALYDGQPVPKIIDFGVAKATSQKLTEKTMFTQFGQIVGTLEYMSPEQAELNQLDVDTRSDIYSLGVLLYKLLTGVTPFERKRLASAAFDEMLRIIREEEPPRPSMRLSTIDTLATVAANRRTSPQKLSALFRGELDWIVMKALEKDRARRYETASGFSADIQRYLDDEPVDACPPSAGYRLRKFVLRNKAPVVAASVITLTLVAGIFGTTMGYLRSERARRELRQTNSVLEQKNAQISQMLLHQGLAAAMSGNEERTRKFVGSATGAGAPESQTEMLLGLMHWTRGAHSDATLHIERAAELAPDNLGIRAMLGLTYLGTGDQRFMGMSRVLESLDPKTAEDYLFHGHMVFGFQPDLGVRLVERALDMYDSPIAGVVYALTLQEKALQDGDLSLASKALQELAEAEIVLGNEHKMLTSVRLTVLNAAIFLTEEPGAEKDAMVNVADRIASQKMLSSNVTSVEAWMVALFYELIREDIPSARKAWELVMREGAGTIWNSHYAAFLLRHDGLGAARSAFEGSHSPSHWEQTMKLQLLALQPEGRERARQLWKAHGDLGAHSYEGALRVANLLQDHEGINSVGAQWSTRAGGVAINGSLTSCAVNSKKKNSCGEPKTRSKPTMLRLLNFWVMAIATKQKNTSERSLTRAITSIGVTAGPWESWQKWSGISIWLTKRLSGNTAWSATKTSSCTHFPLPLKPHRGSFWSARISRRPDTPKQVCRATVGLQLAICPEGDRLHLGRDLPLSRGGVRRMTNDGSS